MGAGSVGTIPAAIRELALAVAGPDEQPISLATQRVA
jgi:hypothetical protein